MLAAAQAVDPFAARPMHLHLAGLRRAAGLLADANGTSVELLHGPQLRADHQGKATAKAHAGSS
ncbi:hypothetical protein ACSSV6_003587 [Roseovarius sp. MBR-38]|jgi:hypothetical protein